MASIGCGEAELHEMRALLFSRFLMNVEDMGVRPDANRDLIVLGAAHLSHWGRQMNLAAHPFAGHDRIVFQDIGFQRPEIGAPGLDVVRDHGLVLHGRIRLGDGVGCWAVIIRRNKSRATRRRHSACGRPVTRARSAVGVGASRRAHKDGCYYLTGPFFGDKRFKGNDRQVHGRTTIHNLCRGNVRDGEIEWLFGEIGDREHEYRARASSHAATRRSKDRDGLFLLRH